VKFLIGFLESVGNLIVNENALYSCVICGLSEGRKEKVICITLRKSIARGFQGAGYTYLLDFAGLLISELLAYIDTCDLLISLILHRVR
jgi:hypothetical protein